MFFRLFLLLVVGAILELWLLLQFGKLTSPLIALLTVIGTAIAGLLIARWQGLRVWRQLREELAQGRAPAAKIIDGVMILFAAALLVTPGLIADSIGLLLLIPPVRKVLRAGVAIWLSRKIAVRVQSFTNRMTPQQRSDVIDAEFHELPPEQRRNLP